MTVREPVLKSTQIADLRPTQITVGLREVAEKVRQWSAKTGTAEEAFLDRHMVPVVLGPKARPYVIDHHHLCRALHEAGQAQVLVDVVADLSRLGKEEFWVFMDNRAWCHPYDAAGERRTFKQIPKAIEELVDDPFRSLAGELRRLGGFAKDTTPFSEFTWADFLRRRIDHGQVRDDFQCAAEEGLKLARSQDANHLPGWCGPSPTTGVGS